MRKIWKIILTLVSAIAGVAAALIWKRRASAEAIKAHREAGEAAEEAEIHADGLIDEAEKLGIEAEGVADEDRRRDEEIFDEALDEAKEITAPRGSAPRPRSEALEELRRERERRGG